ncbi:MAG: hypothetical protein J5986_06320, partial [Roseburia sp.]|nr:hypothetical protein [Roseburia sp.]
TNVNTIFLGIGGVLVVIFFLMGFCADSVDIKQDFRLENILRMFLKLSLAEFFVINSMTIVQKLFALSTGVIGKISGSGTSFRYTVPTEVTEILNLPLTNDISGLGGVFIMALLFIVTIIFMMVTAGCGMLMLFEAFQRFLKILMLVPYGTLANSTIAGNHMLSRSAESFWKYALGTILEAVTMYMAMVLSAVVTSSGVVNLTNGQTGGFYILGWILQSSFICMLTLGTVKGSGMITQKALGL